MDKQLPPAKLPFPVTRAIAQPVEAKAADEGGMPTMVGHFSTFGDWYEVDSAFEGHFMERVAPSAFDGAIAAFAAGSPPKVLYDHGQDPQIGNKILGPVEDLRADEIGPAYVVPLFDTSYNRDLAPGLEAGVYGSSFRFQVEADEWDNAPKASAHNPNALPERTITKARTFEFGPVTFPANAGATAGVRSTTDSYYKRARDPEQFEQLLRSAQIARTPSTPPPAAAKPTPKTQETPVATEYVTRDEKAARVTELNEELARMATSYPGVLPKDEQAKWDDAEAEIRSLNADIAAWDSRQAKLAEFAAREKSIEPGNSAPTVIVRKSDGDIYDMGQYSHGQVRSLADRDQKLRDNAMRSLEGSSFAQSTVVQDKAKEGVQELLDNHDSRDRELAVRMLLTGSPQYKRDFAESLRLMRPVGSVANTAERAAALAVTGTTTTGGYMLPYTFDPTFIKTGAWTSVNPYRQVCRVEQIVGSNNWQGVSVGAVPAIYETEALAVTEAGPTFARPSLTAQRASSFVSLSYETLQDRPDVVSEIADLIQEGKDTLEENQFSIGVGTTVYPLGMFVKSTFTVKETITNDTFAVADLDATEAALPIRHRAQAIWMLSRAVIRIIQGWETAYGKYFESTLGYPAAGPLPAFPPGGNTGLRLLGYPVWETPSAPATVTTDDTIVGILVSPKNYMILDRVGMNVELIPNLVDGDGKPTGQRGILALWRNTAKALNADAGRQININ